MATIIPASRDLAARLLWATCLFPGRYCEQCLVKDLGPEQSLPWSHRQSTFCNLVPWDDPFHIKTDGESEARQFAWVGFTTISC
jgi:hypothetical protein